MSFAAPRSTCHHWPLAHGDAQRVAELPSTALAGPSAADSLAEAVAACPRASSTTGSGFGSMPNTLASQKAGAPLGGARGDLDAHVASGARREGGRLRARPRGGLYGGFSERGAVRRREDSVAGGVRSLPVEVDPADVSGPPRSTCHQWPSANGEDQRVAELPSTALAGPSAADSLPEAVAGRPRARSER